MLKWIIFSMCILGVLGRPFTFEKRTGVYVLQDGDLGFWDGNQWVPEVSTPNWGSNLVMTLSPQGILEHAGGYGYLTNQGLIIANNATRFVNTLSEFKTPQYHECFLISLLPQRVLPTIDCSAQDVAPKWGFTDICPMGSSLEGHVCHCPNGNTYEAKLIGWNELTQCDPIPQTCPAGNADVVVIVLVCVVVVGGLGVLCRRWCQKKQQKPKETFGPDEYRSMPSA